MKYSKIRISLVAAAIVSGLYCTYATADVEQGAKVSGQLTLGKRSFALPPGDWIVVSSADAKVSFNNGASGSDTKRQYLVQVDDKNTLKAAMLLNTTLSSTGRIAWSDTTCDRKDTVYRDTLDGRIDLPACLLINHVTNFWGGSMPTNDFDKTIWNWYRENKVALPYNVISANYVKYFAGDFVRSIVWLNPEISGLVDKDKKAWADSPWHINYIKSDIQRTAYVEQIKTWSQAMAKNSKATLMDTKPIDPSLPILPGLN
jgi:hypothetical protein